MMSKTNIDDLSAPVPAKRVAWMDLLIRLTFALLLAGAAVAEARAEALGARPIVRIKPAVQVQGEVITLGEVAQITNSVPEYQKLVAVLQSVQLGEAPPPRMRTTLPGARILAAIEAAGVDRNSILYSIPTSVEVERSGRVIQAEDVLPAVQDLFRSDVTLDVQVREVVWSNGQIIPSGSTRYEIERLGDPRGGKVPLRVVALVNEKPAARFLATAVVDDWREVPVLNKTIERGMLIQPSDVEMVRLNLFKQPDDVAAKAEAVIGRRTKARLGAGTTIRRGMIDIPPVIPAGKRITMIFKKGGFQATATGIAIEDGLEDAVIKVKNESSRKLVRARVVNENEVEVTAE